MVSIITVSYNEPEATYDMLASVASLNYDDTEVLVVDNGSTERPLSAERIHELLPQARLITSQINLGFGGGNNLGIKEAIGEYLLLVNNDTILSCDIIEEMLTPFQTQAGVGAVSPKILYWDHPKVIQYAGFTRFSKYTGRNECIGQFKIDSPRYDVQMETGSLHGAAMLIKHDVLRQTGSFYEPFFLYYEESDLSERIRRAGYKIIFQPRARVYHKDSLSVGRVSLVKTFYMARNRILFMKRNQARTSYLIFLAFYLSISLPKTLVLLIYRKRFKHVWEFLKGSFKGIAMAPGVAIV